MICNRVSALPLLAVALLWGHHALSAQNGRSADSRSTNSVQPQADFKIIAEKNIFNSKRYARSTSNSRRDVRPQGRTELLILTGTLAYDKGNYAFFDGSHNSFRKVIENKGNVEDLEVVQILPNAAVLMSGTNEIVLKVGEQLKKAEKGSWTHGGRADSMIAQASPPPPPQTNQPSPTPPTSSNPETEPSEIIARAIESVLRDGAAPLPPPPAPPTENGGAEQPPPAVDGTAPSQPPPVAAPSSSDDVLRRLIERREQELNQ